MNDYKVIKAAMEKVIAPIEDPEGFNTGLVDEYQHTPYVNEKTRTAQYPWNDSSAVLSFGGLLISPAPVYYDGSEYIFKDSDWNHNSYNEMEGASEGSYYFNGNNNNIVIDGYRVPTSEDWIKIITTDASVRSGSTVNGNKNKHYSLIRLIEDGNYTFGLILFPDNATITGAELKHFDDKDLAFDDRTEVENYLRDVTIISKSDLDNYLSEGCAFLPAFGIHDGEGLGIDPYGNSCLGVYGCQFPNGSDEEQTSVSINLTSDPYGGSLKIGNEVLNIYDYVPYRLVKDVE